MAIPVSRPTACSLSGTGRVMTTSDAMGRMLRRNTGSSCAQAFSASTTASAVTLASRVRTTGRAPPCNPVIAVLS